jgi:hypothetical protein
MTLIAFKFKQIASGKFMKNKSISFKKNLKEILAEHAFLKELLVVETSLSHHLQGFVYQKATQSLYCVGYIRNDLWFKSNLIIFNHRLIKLNHNKCN